MGTSFKDISCGFCSLSMKEVRDGKKTQHTPGIKGGSPDLPVEKDNYDFKQGMNFFKKISRGTITPQLKMDLRHFKAFSSEGKFNISMLPNTCIINKKLMHFYNGYRNYLAQKLCKELSNNHGFSVPTGNHVIKSFPFIIDNPDICENFLQNWHTNVIKKIPKESQKNLKYITKKTEEYISRMYLVKYSDIAKIEEGSEYETAIGDENAYKARVELTKSALNTDMPGITFKPKVKMEAMTTFKPFNIRELEVDVFDSQQMRIQNYQNEFEQNKGLRRRSKSKNKSKNRDSYDRDEYDR